MSYFALGEALNVAIDAKNVILADWNGLLFLTMSGTQSLLGQTRASANNPRLLTDR
jgi:hypothetical protein